MEGEAELLGEQAHLVVVVALIQAETLWPLGGRFRSPHHDARQRFAGELVVIAVGAGDADAQGDAGSIGKE